MERFIQERSVYARREELADLQQKKMIYLRILAEVEKDKHSDDFKRLESEIIKLRRNEASDPHGFRKLFREAGFDDGSNNPSISTEKSVDEGLQNKPDEHTTTSSTLHSLFERPVGSRAIFRDNSFSWTSFSKAGWKDI